MKNITWYVPVKVGENRKVIDHTIPQEAVVRFDDGENELIVWEEEGGIKYFFNKLKDKE